MKKISLIIVILSSVQLTLAQIIPNGNFKKWGSANGNCPSGWSCNNDVDCKGKVTIADKIKGGAKLTVMNCFDPKKQDRSNNVNLSFQNDFAAKIPKDKKVKISFDYSYTPIVNDAAYVHISIDMSEELPNLPTFFYSDNEDGNLKPGLNQHMVCYLNFDASNGKKYAAPQNLNASSLDITFGIMPELGTDNTHKGTTLILNNVKFEIE